MKTAGDVQVRLSSVTRSSPLFGLFYIDPEIVSNADPGAGWIIDKVILSDATGNQNLISRLTDSSPRYFGQILLETLWPDENAWKLAIEIKRTNNPAPAELVSFKAVPVPPAPAINTPALEVGSPLPSPLLTNIIDGQRIVLAYFTNTRNVLSSDAIPFPGARVELPDKPSDVALDFVRAVTDTGATVQKIRDSGDGSSLEIQFQRLPANAKTVDLTFRLQKTRTVEFLFRPPPPN